MNQLPEPEHVSLFFQIGISCSALFVYFAPISFSIPHTVALAMWVADGRAGKMMNKHTKITHVLPAADHTHNSIILLSHLLAMCLQVYILYLKGPHLQGLITSSFNCRGGDMATCIRLHNNYNIE